MPGGGCPAIGEWTTLLRISGITDGICHARLPMSLKNDFANANGITYTMKRNAFSTTVGWFLANVNSRSRSLYAIARPSVCRLSVTFVRPTQAIEIFGNISAALGTLAIH